MITGIYNITYQSCVYLVDTFTTRINKYLLVVAIKIFLTKDKIIASDTISCGFKLLKHEYRQTVDA